MLNAMTADMPKGSRTCYDFEHFILKTAVELNLPVLHDAFVSYVTVGCHPGIAARRALVECFSARADELRFSGS
ncbi:hypothetical protein [Hyphomicrobium sp.]|uniref:hypothetical protein n=1 Tax=Hyphomicrobium sp. TaxID=82 RepID=UPI001DAB959F|nr:hypothetical protein [Hyphomicrobium sp.]MBY0562443.1 hypothetical protein [Hyphomicrobium sp.]